MLFGAPAPKSRRSEDAVCRRLLAILQCSWPGRGFIEGCQPHQDGWCCQQQTRTDFVTVEARGNSAEQGYIPAAPAAEVPSAGHTPPAAPASAPPAPREDSLSKAAAPRGGDMATPTVRLLQQHRSAAVPTPSVPLPAEEELETPPDRVIWQEAANTKITL
eukprot:TRINITY_DN36554_c0_g2_i2.p1 TRINITY_DN36554_c0_g2~~TRINITY_DN36554_c0_g2_i2.p1  ORF type:complete len:161 (+),score=26.90 TRINITY_DN36554_c0_g2_i2:233-715(+)